MDSNEYTVWKMEHQLIIFYKTYDIYHAVNWLTQLNSNL